MKNKLLICCTALLLSYSEQILGSSESFLSFPNDSTVDGREDGLDSLGNRAITDSTQIINNELIRVYAPDKTSTSNVPVGSSQGEFQVSSTGGATYSIAIDMPEGIHGMQPSIALTYNSQGGNGIAGWGFNLSGVSSITCVPRDVYHDGVASGVKYDRNDAFSLDGKRLILKSGTEGTVGAVYSLESEPFTEVTISSMTNGSIDYFTVHSPDGMTYEYGRNSASQHYTVNGAVHCAAWYISLARNPLGNTMNYYYGFDQNCAYLSTIVYHQNIISFTYETRSNDPIKQNVGGREVIMGKRLKTITTRRQGQTYREYQLAYDTTSDASGISYSRLISVTERNGSGESMYPIVIDWNYLGGFSHTPSIPSVPLAQSSYYDVWNSRMFTSADLNGDGISDIIQISPVQHYYYRTSYGSSSVFLTYVYVYPSERQSNGDIRYKSPLLYKFPNVANPLELSELKQSLLGISYIDLDGDGLQDICIPISTLIEGSQTENRLVYNYILGRQVADGETNVECSGFSQRIWNADDAPLHVIADFDKDGRSEAIHIEKGQTNNHYYSYCAYQNSSNDFSFQGTALSLPADPEHLFSGDFNNDGLVDIIVFHETGYVVFLNNGVQHGNYPFSNTNKMIGTLDCEDIKLYQGDFNGDGLIDFLFGKEESQNFYFLTCNGDGTFTKTLACSMDIYDQPTVDDDNYFSVVVYDFNHDGRSDVFFSKAVFVLDYQSTKNRWMRSTGTNLVEEKRTQTSSMDDAQCGHVFAGDFAGNGSLSLMNLGRELYNQSSNTDTLRLYVDAGYNISRGRISSIEDGFGNETHITYKSLSDNSVYERQDTTSYPFISVTIPLPVVSQVVSDNGAAGSTQISYNYADLKWNSQGKGICGFLSQVITDETLGKTVNNEIVEWNNRFCLPRKVKMTTIQGGLTSVTEQSNSIYTYGSNNYKLCVGLIKETDIYGNIRQTFYEYDTSIGCLSEKAIEDDSGDFYQIETYSDYVQAGGSYHPQTITKTLFHPDDDEEFIQETQLTYNEKGQKVSVVENAQSSALSLTTYYTYDNNGNLVLEYSQGAGVPALRKIYVYNTPCQKVTHTYTYPASTIIDYTYDFWGNLLTETDNTNSSAPLTTTHTYDGWGNLLTSTSPEGITRTLTRGWGQTAAMKHFIVEEQTGAPWLKTWYDSKGREVRTESVGEDHVSVTSSKTFNNKGQVVTKRSSSGMLILLDQYTYDALGRVESETLSSGKTTTYSYGDRSTTTVVNGHTYVKTYDPWGNVITSTDPVSSVTFKYASNGKPVSATVGNNVVSMSYDEVGNRISLDDPDAGLNTYEYDALGRVTQKTDGNGRVSTYTYDVYGRLVCEQMGNQYYGNTINYTYGTQGNAAMRLVRKEMTNRILKYEYDGFGRVAKETRLQPDEDSLTVEYTYNGNGLLGSVVYPGNVQVSYSYDDVGNKVQTFCNGVSAWKLQSFDGRIQESHICGDTIRHREVHNAKGYLSYLTTYRFGTRLDTIGFEFDEPTGNLIHRGRYNYFPSITGENFQYDAVDRLVNAKNIGTISYSSNGNISSMQNLGSYYYSDYDHPTSNHAVIRIGNQYDTQNYTTLDTCYQSIDYNAFNKFTFIDQYPGNRGYCMRVQYGPDKERWTSQLEEDNVVRQSILHAGDYERVTVQGITRHYYYLGNGVMMIRRNGVADKLYYACTDNIGSICRIYDSNGTNVFYANYNAWGKQTVTTNTIAFHRGFTGHEMMSDFQLINMNGRLYDPLIGRFLSPDNYVQLPDFSQNYNRYSYCLNNPLKYTDPSGEVFGIDDCIAALIGGTINLVTNLIEGNVTSFWHGFTLFSAGALSGWGSLYCPLLAVPLLSGGNSIINQGFTYGLNNISWDQVVGSTAMGSAMFITGGVLGSFASIPISSITEKIASPVLREVVNQGIVNSTIGFITRTGLAYVNGESFEDALQLGFHDFLTGLALGTINGTAKGIQYARNNKISPWTGERINNHHSHPIFIGGDEHQKLTPMSESRHRQLHKDLNDYLREQINEQGYHMRPQRGNNGYKIRYNFTDEQRFNAIKGFYDQHPIKYWDARYDFYRNTNTSWKPFNFGR